MTSEQFPHPDIVVVPYEFDATPLFRKIVENEGAIVVTPLQSRWMDEAGFEESMIDPIDRIKPE